MKYVDKECYELAVELRDLMARALQSSKRDSLPLAQKIVIKDVAHILDAQSRKLLAINEMHT